jgi:signal transduction histidine kinase
MMVSIRSDERHDRGIPDHVFAVVPSSLLFRNGRVGMGTHRREERILAGWAHDLGKPLQVIGLQARRLANEIGQDKQACELAQTIVALSDDALSVIDRLMECARPNESRAAQCDELGAILRRVVVLIRGLHPGCEFWIRGSIPAVEIAQPGRLFSALVNFADNAIRASEPWHAVTISARWDGDKLAVDVIDRGTGMSDAVRKQAFDPYFSTRRSSRPTGLGLPESRAQIESMGGHVELESIEGNGTRASVVLPGARVSSRLSARPSR